MRQSESSLLLGLRGRERSHVTWLMSSSQLGLYQAVSALWAAGTRILLSREELPFPGSEVGVAHLVRVYPLYRLGM